MGDKGLNRRSAADKSARAGTADFCNIVEVRNRQRRKRISPNSVRKLVDAVLKRLDCRAEVGIHLVGAREMARLNWDYLHHEGSTDVITFDHGSKPGFLHGEGFVCVADAISQAATWKTTWEKELGRYVIHALLHLAGYDDRLPAARKAMKRQEEIFTRRLVVDARWRAGEP